MNLRERPRRKPTEGVGERTRQCEVSTCTSSARLDGTFPGSETKTRLCRKHADEWAAIYEQAWLGFPDEPAHELAEHYRAGAAA